MDRYVEQHKNFGLGNFINLTPTIRHLYNEGGIPIRVHFHSDYVRECYIDSPYVEIVDNPKGDYIMTSGLICRANTMPDYIYVQEQILGVDSGCASFIDTPKTTIKGKYAVIINGSGNESIDYVNLKHIEANVWDNIIEASDIPVYLVGSKEDAARNISIKCDNIMVGNIRDALSAINGAEWVISNDTGLAHAAGVMNKKLMVLFKDTLFPKNKNTGSNSQYSFKGNHIQDIKKFLNDMG